MHALPHSKSSVFLCAVFYVVHVSGSLAPIRRRCCRQQDLHALASRGSQAVCVCIRVCVYAGVTRGTLDIHHTHTHTDTHITLCSSSVSSTRDMEGTKLRWITDLGDRRALFTPKLFIFPPAQSLNDPLSIIFLLPIFSCCFCFIFIFAPMFSVREEYCAETHLKRSVFTKKDSDLHRTTILNISIIMCS